MAQELEGRADAKAPREIINSIAVGTLHKCGYCQRQDHHAEICPKRAADVRGDSAKCLEDFERGGGLARFAIKLTTPKIIIGWP